LESGALHDDRSIWHRAYQDHGPSILAFLRSRVGRRDLAEEFLQETFVRAMRRGAGEAPGSNLRAYLFTTAHHLVISDRRRARVWQFSELPKDEAGLDRTSAQGAASPEAAIDLGRVRDRLEEAVRALSPAQRAAFQAAVLDQKPYADIAREHGWSVEQVKVNVHRARKRVIGQLRDILCPAPVEESSS